MKVKIITGAPCSGKTTYVLNHAGRNDIIYDYDRLMNALTINQMHDNNPLLLDYILDIQRSILMRLQDEQMIDTAWIVSLQYPSVLDEFVFYDVEHIHIDTSIDECMRRLESNAEGRDIEQYKNLIKNYIPPIKR